jgi:hypothetical protein
MLGSKDSTVFHFAVAHAAIAIAAPPWESGIFKGGKTRMFSRRTCINDRFPCLRPVEEKGVELSVCTRHRLLYWLSAAGCAGLVVVSPHGLAARNARPSVTITKPVSGATYTLPANITITASATDSDGRIVKVEFFQGQTKIGESSTAPYGVVWSNVPAGTYSLWARAIDNRNADAKSGSISVTVVQDQRAATGEWSGPALWPDVAIHLHLLPDGKLLSFSDDDHVDFHTRGTRAAGRTRSFVVTIPANAPPSLANWYEVPNTRTNLFCSGHAYLPDGRLLVMGGHDGRDYDGSSHTTIFDWRRTSPWDYSNPDMASGRWYPSAVTLANGEVLTISGTRTTSTDLNPLPEVWKTNSGGGWRALTNAIRTVDLYPMIHVAPNGKVFMAGPHVNTHYLDTGGTGAWSFVATRRAPFRGYGSAVMYHPGKVLLVGGGDPPLNSAEVIDLNAATPAWRLVGSMSKARRHLNATLLADGTVLATGGTSSAGFNTATGTVLVAELWNPATESWSTMASMQTPRLYHSSALLLPDGRVLSAGGGRPAASGITDQENVEIFSPPYLFKGPRPTISSAPTSAGYGATFFVGTPDSSDIAQVSLVRLGSATHAIDMNQRFNQLNFTAATGGLNVIAPSGRTLAPPGHYMLFILSRQGVPSIARIIQLL